MSGNNGSNGADWARLFAEFHDRHKGSDKKNLKFIIVFNAAMDGFIGCADVPLMWRVLAWIWRNSWGNFSDWCVDGIRGKALGQQACADDFGVTKQRINDCVVALREFNFVIPSTGHKLSPVDDPGRTAPQTDNSDHPESPDPSGLFKEFCEEWKVRSLADFQELEAAESVVNRLKIVRLGQFREWKRARTSGGASLYRTVTITKQLEESVSPSEVDRPTDPPIPEPALPPEPPAPSLEASKPAEEMETLILQEAGAQFPTEVPGRSLCLQIIQTLADTPWDEFRQKLRSRKWKRDDSMGLTRSLAQEVRDRWLRDVRKRPRPAPDPKAEEDNRAREIARNYLDHHKKDPDDPILTPDLLDWARKTLGEVATGASN